MNETNTFINYISSLEDRITKLEEDQNKTITVGSITFNNTFDRPNFEKTLSSIIERLRKSGIQST